MIENDWIEYIGINVPSSKNSKRICNKKLINSPLVRKYKESMGYVFNANRKLWNKQIKADNNNPLFVGFYFYRDSRRHWDFMNIVQIIADMMQDSGYISDDDTKHFIPIYLGEELTDKNNAGFKMKILDENLFLDIMCQYGYKEQKSEE